jgi:hypothetical protein
MRENLTISTNYQLQASGDLSTWTNTGSAFTATNTNMVYPTYFDVDNWGTLFFRLQWHRDATTFGTRLHNAPATPVGYGPTNPAVFRLAWIPSPNRRWCFRVADTNILKNTNRKI